MVPVTHPSQPNYAASVAGDTFGMENDDYLCVRAVFSACILSRWRAVC